MAGGGRPYPAFWRSSDWVIVLDMVELNVNNVETRMERMNQGQDEGEESWWEGREEMSSFSSPGGTGTF